MIPSSALRSPGTPRGGAGRAARGRGAAAIVMGAILLAAGRAPAAAAPEAAAAPALGAPAAGDPLAGVSIGGLAYFDYSLGRTPMPQDRQADLNRFKLTRGYLTVKKQISGWLSARITMDLTQDDSGDYKRREKYYYAEARAAGGGLLTDLRAEIGMGHMPWLDFEEHINPYRCQGTMAIERAGTFNSADLGVSLRGGFGGRLADAKRRTGNTDYDGRWGSWHVGVYNGGGYHASEKNENKTLQGRLTLRPLPDRLPGLQGSCLGILGRGNVAATDSTGIPDYRVALIMASYEHPRATVTLQRFATEGNAKGTWVDAGGAALQTRGWSAFAVARLDGAPGRWSAWARYDRFDADQDDAIADRTAYDLLAGGVVCDLHKGNLVMLVYEQTRHEADFGSQKGAVPAAGTRLGDERKLQLVQQIKF